MTSSTAPLPPDSLFGPGRLGASAGAVALISLLAFEAIAVATAMPAIARALDGLGLYAMAFGGMLATSMLGMVLAGRSCDRHGSVPATAWGLTVFAAGLLLAGLGDSMPWMVAGRIVQGLGSGMLGVALYVGMGQLIPPPLHPRLFALMAAAWVLPGLVGPLVAAGLVDQFGWRAVFLAVAAVVPFAGALLLPAFARLPVPTRIESAARRSAAPLAFAGLAVASALLLHAAGRPGMAWVVLLPMLALGFAGALGAASRLLPPGALVAKAGLPSVIALRGLLAASFATAEVFVPLYLTREAGWSLLQAGGALSAGAVFWSGGSAVQARIVGESQRRRGLRAGFLAVAVGIALVALPMLTGLPVELILLGWSIASFGIGLGFPMLSVLTLGLSPAAEQGNNASALQLCDALCSAASLAAAGALFALSGGAGSTGYVLVLALAWAMALAGALLSRRAFACAD